MKYSIDADSRGFGGVIDELPVAHVIGVTVHGASRPVRFRYDFPVLERGEPVVDLQPGNSRR